MKRPYRKYRMTVYVTDQWTAGAYPNTKPLSKADLIKQVQGVELAGLVVAVDPKSFEILDDRPAKAQSAARRQHAE